MNLQITPSQRRFADAHKHRVEQFWERPEPSPPNVSNEWFNVAWRMLDLRPSIATIKDEVCRHYKVPAFYMETEERTYPIMKSRCIAIYLCRELTLNRNWTIGQHFGKRDRTTVSYSLKRAARMIENDPAIRRDVEELKIKLGANHD